MQQQDRALNTLSRRPPSAHDIHRDNWSRFLLLVRVILLNKSAGSGMRVISRKSKRAHAHFARRNFFKWQRFSRGRQWRFRTASLDSTREPQPRGCWRLG